MKQQYARSSQYDQILKKNEQLYTLLALTLALCPAAQRCVDEVIINILREKYALAVPPPSASHSTTALVLFAIDLASKERHRSLTPAAHKAFSALEVGCWGFIKLKSISQNPKVGHYAVQREPAPVLESWQLML